MFIKRGVSRIAIGLFSLALVSCTSGAMFVDMAPVQVVAGVVEVDWQE